MKDILISIASTVILALVTWISERLIALINAKIRNQRFAHYLTAATAAVTDAVKATQQEYVDGLKKSGIPGRENISIESKNAHGDYPTAQSIGQEIVSKKYDYVVTLSTLAAQVTHIPYFSP